MIPNFTPAHEYAEIFALHDEGLGELAKRIEAHGQREPCVRLDGKMLDGRRRERACHKAGVTPTYREFGSRKSDGDDPLEFVIDLNLHRRHLGDGERLIAAAKYATAKGGGNREKVPLSQNAKVEPTRADAAEKFDVPASKLDRAKKVVATGTPALQQAVADETITVSDAAKVASEPAKVQDQAVKNVVEGKAKTAKASVPPKPPKAGRVLYSFKSFESCYGALIREVDALGNAYKVKESAEAKRLRKMLSEFRESFTAWHKELVK